MLKICTKPFRVNIGSGKYNWMSVAFYTSSSSIMNTQRVHFDENRLKSNTHFLEKLILDALNLLKLQALY